MWEGARFEAIMLKTRHYSTNMIKMPILIRI